MDYDKRVDGKKLLEKLGTPEIYRSYIMGEMLFFEPCEIRGGKQFFSVSELINRFNYKNRFEFLFPKYTQSETDQAEESGVAKSIGNDFSNGNAPNRRPG